VEDFVREEVNRLEQSDLFLDVYVRESYTLLDQEHTSPTSHSAKFFNSESCQSIHVDIQ
jgi:hypothetical protein